MATVKIFIIKTLTLLLNGWGFFHPKPMPPLHITMNTKTILTLIFVNDWLLLNKQRSKDLAVGTIHYYLDENISPVIALQPRNHGLELLHLVVAADEMHNHIEYL